jgi:hypothetical protein
VQKQIKFYVPYATPASFKGGSGLGLIDETDWWRTGRPYGLPGTQAIFLPGGRPGTPGVGVPIRVPSYMSGQVFPPGYEGPQTLSGFGGPLGDATDDTLMSLSQRQTTYLGLLTLGVYLGVGVMVAREIRKRRTR